MTRKDKPRTSKPDSENLPLEPAERIAKIKSLQAEIDAQIRALNDPYASIASIIAIPLLVNLLFLSEMSPLHETYVQLHQDYFDTFLQNRWQPLNEIFIKRQKEVKEGYNYFVSRIEALKSVKEFNVEGLDLSLDDILNKIDNTPAESKFTQPFKQLKNAMANSFKLASTDHAHYSKEIQKKIIEVSNNQYSFKQTFYLAQQACHDYLKMMSIVPQKVGNTMAEQYAKAEIDNSLMLVKVILMMTGKKFFIEPLFKRWFPNGVFQEPIPYVGNLNLLTKTKTDSAIVLLEKHKVMLSTKVRYNVKVSRYLLAVIVPLAIYMLAEVENASPEIIVITLSLLSTALTNIINETYSFLMYYYLNNILNRKCTNISQIFSDVKDIDLNIVAGQDLNSSCFKISHKNKALLKIIKSCFIFNKVNVVSHGEKVIFIAATTRFSFNKIAAIKNMLGQYIDRVKAIKKLKAQISTLSQNNSINFNYFPGFNKNNLPTCKFELYLQLSDNIQELTALMIETFPGNKLESFQEESGFRVVIKGIAPSAEALLKNFSKQFKVKRKEESEYMSFVNSDNELQIIRKKIKKTSPSGVANISQQGEIENKKLSIRIVRWPSGNLYTSENNNGKVYPFNIGRVYDNKFLRTTRFFIRNDLKFNKFPSALKEIYTAICTLIEQSPHIVPGKGYTGFIFASGWERDQYDNWFPYSLKGKLLGDKGDVRIYAESETNKEGNVLYRVKGVNLNAH